MVVKVYISGISGNKEVKKRQQRVLLILDSKNVKYEVIDIAEPNQEEAKDFMQNNSKFFGGTIGDPNPRHPLPPQIFNDDVYCGDYDAFDMANEIDEMEKFLKLEPDDSAPTVTSNAEIKLENGNGLLDKDEKEETIPEVEAPIENVGDSKKITDEEKLADQEAEKLTEREVNETEGLQTEESVAELPKEPEAIEDAVSEQKIENETDDQKVENGSKQVEAAEEEAAVTETEKSEA